MKKLLIILCFLPIFSFGSAPYKILSDTVFIGSIPYRTATGELLLFNNTKDTTESVLYNTGSGKTEFKKVRLIRLNDSTYVFKIGTTVIGDSIKIHSSGSGGGGGIESIVAGTNITVDDTDPENPIVSSINNLFPNGINFISSDYELQTSDEGKIIYSTTPNVNITMPASVIFEGGKNIGLYLINGGTFQRISSDSAIQVLPFIGGSILDSLSNKQGEFLILYTLSVGDGGNSQLLTVSAGILEDNGVLKTVDKYLYDKIATKVDTAYLFRNATLDSTCLIVTINGLSYRTCAKDSVGSGGGGGASISGLTVAIATNSLDNLNFKQRWSWNTIAGDTAFVLESVSTTAANNLQNVFTIKTSGANATSTQTTCAQRISNTHTGTSSTNVGLDITASGATNNYALLATGRVGIGVSTPSYALDVSGDIRLTSTYRFSGASTILEANGGLNLTGAAVVVSSSNTGGVNSGYQFRTIGSDALSQTSLNMPTVGSKFSIAFGTSYINGSYLKLNANPVIIENSSGNLIFYSNTGLTVDASGYTPTEIVRFKSDGSIGVGTNSPAASSKLDLTSTTQGFLPPRMTTTQRDAISTPAAGLIIYNTTTNKLNVFTTTWEVITSL